MRKDKKTLQILSAIPITAAVWGLGIPVAGKFVCAEVIDLTKGVQVLNLLYPLLIILFAGVCGYLCKKKDRSCFFYTVMIMLALPLLSYPLYTLLFKLPYPGSLIGYPFLLLASLPASVATGVSYGIGQLVGIPIYEIPNYTEITAWILIASAPVIGLIVFKKTERKASS